MGNEAGSGQGEHKVINCVILLNEIKSVSLSQCLQYCSVILVVPNSQTVNVERGVGKQIIYFLWPRLMILLIFMTNVRLCDYSPFANLTVNGLPSHYYTN